MPTYVIENVLGFCYHYPVTSTWLVVYILVLVYDNSWWWIGPLKELIHAMIEEYKERLEKRTTIPDVTDVSTPRLGKEDLKKHAVFEPKKSNLKWRKRRDYKREEANRQEHVPHTSTVYYPDAWRYWRTYRRHMSFYRYRNRSDRFERSHSYIYPDHDATPLPFDREAHIQAVHSNDERERELEQEAERIRKERAIRERNDRTKKVNSNIRPKKFDSSVHWQEKVQNAADAAKRASEKEKSQDRVREHKKQLEDMEDQRVAQLMERSELRRIGREIGGV